MVVCIDGTSNQYGVKVFINFDESVFMLIFTWLQNTNVIELYRHLDVDGSQLTYYNSGVGTYARPSWRSWAYLKQVADNKIDLAIAW